MATTRCVVCQEFFIGPGDICDACAYIDRTFQAIAHEHALHPQFQVGGTY